MKYIADYCMVCGLCLGGFGIYLTAGLGWASIAIGIVLFVAGGLDRVKR